MIFPVLSVGVARDGFSELPIDATLRDQTDGPYVFTRPLNTRMITVYKLKFELMNEDDITSMRDFIKNQARGSSVIFVWTHPVNGNEFQVRFKSWTDFVYQGTNDAGGLYNFDCELEEV